MWLEPDLPSYHWFCGVPSARIEQYFDNLLIGVRRSIYDSSFEGEALSQLDWPEPSRVGDLALARLLPVRQALGQFLSGYEMRELRENLDSVAVRYCDAMSGEGARLMEWLRDCLGEGEKHEDSPAAEAKYILENCGGCDSECSLALEFKYSDGRYFKWRKFAEGSMGEIEASLGKSIEKISTRVKPLGAEQTIAEALFF